jgi:hypothetical protein
MIKQKIFNMTPHPVELLDKNNKVIMTFPPSGKTIRLKSKTEISEWPFSKTTFEAIPEFPLPEKTNNFYIVSQLVKSTFDRDDFVVPAEVVRNESGQIIGCRSLGK